MEFLQLPSGLQYDFFTAGIAQPPYPDDCPSPDWGCNYAPSAVEGIAELLFYEGSTGYAECYSVDAQSNFAIQTVNIGWRTTWTEILSAKFMNKTPGRNDLLFYSQSEGHGEFYQTGMIGDMHQVAVHDNWRNSWGIIVPGSFSAPGAMDLLFYEPSDGVGEFDHTDGRGNLTVINTKSGWRTGWKIILPGKFSHSAYTDLLFYSPSEGTGNFTRPMEEATSRSSAA